MVITSAFQADDVGSIPIARLRRFILQLGNYNMGVRGELYSEKLTVADGKRSYFFNVKQNRNGDHFIVIAENVFKFDDRVDRQQIVVYEEHLDDFRYALNKAITMMKKTTDMQKKQNTLPRDTYKKYRKKLD